jgi:hypothetical protein
MLAPCPLLTRHHDAAHLPAPVPSARSTPTAATATRHAFAFSLWLPERCFTAQLPTLQYKIAGVEFPLGPDFYVLYAPDDSGQMTCQLGIQGLDPGLGLWILGDPFLRKCVPQPAQFACC